MVYATHFYYSAIRNDLNDKEIDLNIQKLNFIYFHYYIAGFMHSWQMWILVTP